MPCASGFTLAESLIAAVVLAISVLAVGGVLAAASQQSSDSQEQLTAVSLARELMEEIAAKPLADPLTGAVGPGSEASDSTRRLFNNIGDYAGYTDNTTNLKDRQGNTLPFYGGRYERTVTVTWYALPDSAPGAPITWTLASATAPANAALVTVTIRTPSLHSLSISRLALASAVTR
jgi:type II secretory pathway pseudopilin PulG